MLVTVTGGTGFVGSHSVAALVAAGHRVRLLVRDPAAVERALEPLGVSGNSVDVVVGGVTQEIAVARAVRGADAVLHAASVYSFDSRQRAAIRATNAHGTEIVLNAARRAWVDPIVHVSSVVALYPAVGRVIRIDSPVGRPHDAYMASKAEAEIIARRHQDDGAPVIISYPPALLGPHDPRLGDQSSRLRDLLRGLMPMWPLGGFPVGDVRDTASMHAALLTSSARYPYRYFGPNRYLTTREFIAAVRATTGRMLPTAFLPAAAMLPVGLLADRMQRFVPWHLPVEHGAIYTCACATRVDEERGADEGAALGIRPRPLSETLADTIGWLYRSGQLSARQAGALSREPAERRAAAMAAHEVSSISARSEG